MAKKKKQTKKQQNVKVSATTKPVKLSPLEQEQLEFEQLKIELEQKLSHYKFKHPAFQYIVDHNPSYIEYVEYLLTKYGPVPEDYVIKNKNGTGYRKNTNITKANFEIHHIYEIEVANLSDPVFYPFTAFQKASALVYADYIEHAILHYLIVKETSSYSDLGWGGLFNHHMYRRLLTMIDRDDYIHFGYLISILSLKMAKKVAAVDSVKEVPLAAEIRIGFEKEVYSKALYKYPYGISSITVEEYGELGYKTGNLINAKEILVLRSFQDNLMFIERARNEKLLVLNGGAHKTLAHNDPNWYLEKMDAYYNFCNEFMQLYTNKIQPIVELVKQRGGSGYVHGAIIDYDFYYHIKLDFENNLAIPYCAQNVGSRTIFPSFELMLQQPLLNSTNNVQKDLVLNDAISNIQGLCTPICQKSYYSQEKNFYSCQSAITKIQRTADIKIIKGWESKYEDDLFWMQYSFQNQENLSKQLLSNTEEPS